MKRVILVLMILMVLPLTSCSHIEDTNGPDDYSVVTITDEKIISGVYSTMCVGVFETEIEVSDELTGSYKVSKLSGITEINTYRSRKDLITFNIEFTCESGNAMIVIISNDEIIKKIEANQNVTFEVTNTDHQYKILLVGESAKASINYEVVS